jgi:CelD/BcsL family acetyltransferase involved in cellulose biosynthesis
MRRFLRPVGATGAEYTDILIDGDIDGRACTEAIWSFARSNCKSDLIVLPFVQSGTHLNRVLDSSDGAAAVEHDVTFLSDMQCEASWESYYNSLSKSHRKKHRNLRKRLAELGELNFEVVSAGDPRCTALVQWMLEQKRIWAEHTGKRGKWLYSDEYRELLVQLMQDSDAKPRRVIMSLALDGKPIAVKIGAISKNLFELLIAGFDARLDKFSPGTRLDEHWVRWAIEQELRIDFGVGGEHYKRFWTRDNEVRVNSYLIPNSLLGLVELKLRRDKAVPRHAKGATYN